MALAEESCERMASWLVMVQDETEKMRVKDSKEIFLIAKKR